MQPGHVLVGDDDGGRARHERLGERAGLGEKAGADDDIVAALAEIDAEPVPAHVAASVAARSWSAATTRPTVTSGASRPESITMSALA